MVAQIAARLRGRHLLWSAARHRGGVHRAAFRYDDLLGTRSAPDPDRRHPAGGAQRRTCAGCGRGWRCQRARYPDRGRGGGGSGLAIAIVCRSPTSPATADGGFPRSFWLGELLLTLAALGGVRFGIRATSDWIPRPSPIAVVDRRRTLFFGAGRTGVLMVKSAQRKPQAGVVPVGFLDDDPSLAGGLVAACGCRRAERSAAQRRGASRC
jgi:hypothetical protein